jgi:hypothetical protein
MTKVKKKKKQFDWDLIEREYRTDMNGTSLRNIYY